MSASVETRENERAWERVLALWSEYGRLVLYGALILMVIFAVGRLAYAFPYLVSDPEPWASIDLKYRYAEVQRWFAGLRTYGALELADYPPASYVLLWPFLGWLALEPARWLWAASTAAALGVLAYFSLQESAARSSIHKTFVALLVFSMTPTQMILYTGQLGLHVAVFLAAAFAVLHRSKGGWGDDLLAAALFVPALVKPTMSAPFFWLILFVPGRIRPAALIVAGYAMLTMIGALVQKQDLFGLLGGWIDQANAVATPLEGYANIHKWLAMAGLEGFMLPASLVVLVAVGGWVYRYRRADAWLLLGVVALAAKLWVHHRPHDDILILFALIALFRIATSARSQAAVCAGVLLAAGWCAAHIPIWAFYGPRRISPLVLEIGLSGVWLVVMLFLMAQAVREGTTNRIPQTASPKPDVSQ